MLMNEHQSTLITDMFVMLRFTYVVAITPYTYITILVHMPCSLTWQDIATSVFVNSIAFKDIFSVRESLRIGNNENDLD